MKARLTIAVAATCLTVAVGYDIPGRAQQPAPAVVVPDHQAMLGKYCSACHNEKMKSGGLALSALDLGTAKNADAWRR
jgi:hypothetical protein